MSKAKAYASFAGPDKLEWRLSQFPACMLCDQPAGALPLSVHEIERRSQAPTSWGSLANYLLVCVSCHAGPLATMPHAQQLAWKLYKDPMYYDLQAWLKVKDPELLAPNRVTQAEVDEFVRKIRLNRQ